MNELDKNAVVMSVGQFSKLLLKNPTDILQNSKIWFSTFSTAKGFRVISNPSAEFNGGRGTQLDPYAILQLTPTCEGDMQHLTTLRLGMRDIVGQELLSDELPNFRIGKSTTDISGVVVYLLECAKVPHITTTVGQLHTMLRDAYMDYEDKQGLMEKCGTEYYGILSDGSAVLQTKHYAYEQKDIVDKEQKIRVISCGLELIDSSDSCQMVDLMPELENFVNQDQQSPSTGNKPFRAR